MVGVGNNLPGLGLSVEKYLGDSPFSVFAGAGYIFDAYDGRGARGTGVAGGFRAYSRGRKHRIFGELSFAPVAVEVAPEGSGQRGQAISYGPGASVGYNLVSRGGFTLLISAGVGQAITGPGYVHSTKFVSSLALGHTWRRR